MPPMVALFRLAIILLALTFTVAAHADSWMPPDTEVTLSKNGSFRFTVEPSPLASSLQYFEEELKAQSEGQPVERPTPFGMLERKDAAGNWTLVWAVPLVNDVAPVSALVSGDGRHVVTFDNWHSVGRGKNVVVIYGVDGALVRSMKLTDLVPEDYVAGLPMSVSSTRWKRGSRFADDGDDLLVDLIVPNEDPFSEETETVTVTMGLTDGSVTLPDERAWEAAMAMAQAVKVARDEAEQARLDFLRSPLAAPAGCDASDWNPYLREAFQRMSKQPLFEASTSVVIINPPGHSRHENAVEWFKDDLIEEDYGFPNNVSAVSVCSPGTLAAAVKRAIKGVKPGSLKHTSLYASVSKSEFEKIAALLAPTGAKAVWIDPNAAIPQRPDRIPGSPEAIAAEEAYLKSMMDETSAMSDTEVKPEAE